MFDNLPDRATMNIHDDWLYVISVREPQKQPRTSTPILERKSLVYLRDDPKYKGFCKGLEKPPKRNQVLNNGVEMSVANESLISGHLLTKEDLDMFNEPIRQEDLKQTLSNRIFDLLNGSYKALVRKSSLLFSFKKKRNRSRSSCLNNPQCNCGTHNTFIDLKNINNGRLFCKLNDPNIIVI